MSATRILIVDDDAAIRGLLRVLAERSGIITDEAADGTQALQLLDTKIYDAVLLDLAMPRVNGFDIIDRLRHKSHRPVVIVLSALTTVRFTDLDPSIVHCVIRKPFDVDMLMARMVAAATQLHQQREQAIPTSVPSHENRVGLV